MEEKSKLFVFDKKEVVLIFVFMLVLTTISFTLGIRFGKTISLKKDGFIPSDTQTIELKSVKEEYNENLLEDNPETVIESNSSDNMDPALEEKIKDNETTIARLKEEFETLEKKSFDIEKNNAGSQENIKEEEKKKTPVIEETVNVSNEQTEEATDSNQNSSSQFLKGKYTIQVGSYLEKVDAIKFAEGFIALGYQPMINEVEIKDKGIWHRVSIGAFDSLSDANEFLVKEKEIFSDKDYFITEIK